MWSYRIVAPYQFERTSIAEKTPDALDDGQVLLRFLAAGVCGSDMPAFRGVRGLLPGDHGRSGDNIPKQSHDQSPTRYVTALYHTWLHRKINFVAW